MVREERRKGDKSLKEKKRDKEMEVTFNLFFSFSS